MVEENINIRQKVLSSFLWRFAERCGSQFISVGVSIVLARLLSPDDYGTVALVMVFITILNVLVNSGMGTALVQKEDADELDFSTVFYFNMAISICLYVLLFVVAPFIAGFYDNPELVAVVRVLGINIMIFGVANIQNAYIARRMAFKLSFKVALVANIFSAAIGVSMAYVGFGVWALVCQQIVSGVVNALMLWRVTGWRPKRVFSKERFAGLFSYGSKLLASSLLDVFYANITQLLIGKMYTKKDLGFYTQGERFPKLIINNVDASVQSVLLPAMSRAQDDLARVRSMMRRALQTSCFVIWPLMLLMVAMAEPLVRLLLTEKWLPLLPYMRIFCLNYALWPIHTTNLNAINAIGRSDVFFKLEVCKKVIGAMVLLMTMWHGPLIMAYGVLLNGFLCSFINAYPNNRLLGYRYGEQMRDILPCVLLSACMCSFVYTITFINLGDLMTVIVQLVFGCGVYVIISWVLNVECGKYVFDAAKQLVGGEKN